MITIGLPFPRRSAAGREGTVLARGPWLRTVRRGDRVIRLPQPWCPPPVGRRLLQGLLVGAERFGRLLPVPPLVQSAARGTVCLEQPYLEGATPLRSLPAARWRDPAVAAAIDGFWQAVERCWTSTGWIPDVGGRVYCPWELYQPGRTDNVLVDGQGQCWLVDTGATALFHSGRSPLARLHAALVLRAIRRCRTTLSLERSACLR